MLIKLSLLLSGLPWALFQTPAEAQPTPPTPPVKVVSFSAPSPPYIPNEVMYLPVLKEEVERNWAGVPCRSCLASQVRQETCAGLKSKRCWSIYAELKTSREYGFGLGQITVTSRFNNFLEAKKLDPSMKDWAWENRYNAVYQLRTLVLMNRFNYGKITGSSTCYDHLAFAFAAYNGGLGGLLSDRAMCRATKGCNPGIWFDHVATTSKKTKKSVSGYGRGFFQINREYVQHIMVDFPGRYTPFFKEVPYVRND